jgi:hypothetical protein
VALDALSPAPRDAPCQRLARRRIGTANATRSSIARRASAYGRIETMTYGASRLVVATEDSGRDVDTIVIRGGAILNGEVVVSGSKNAALPRSSRRC